ncbi:2-phospho-L-lactate transferase [Mesorhizobium sp. WSM3879]|uniref:2-phospho-L-lactate transferase n=1 Tax=Mesorhizobium sp. WSM3879 TaxID=2029406 RepID=UPI000BAE8C6B|nr:2-phospho-L-lactate transferase [Mesorhizobium sp. WSM3879]PBB81254.1 2-phospho-L-lactate transferase [Mesorhizobium sp. WSM3879]
MSAGDKCLQEGRYVALSGGVGGAKLSLGLANLLGDRLTIIVNTGDDFEHLGLYVSPDIDTTIYTLSDLVNPDTGWGRRDESWNFMAAIAQLGSPGWFRLGDSDLAMHVERTRRLRAGESLTAVTAHYAECFGIAAKVLPMSDDPVRTIVDTDLGRLAFQEYFVREQCRPRISAINFDGAVSARPCQIALAALAEPNLSGVIICPSNPYLSVDPILAVPGIKEALKACDAPVIAISPIIAGKAVKGPTAKIMEQLGRSADAVTVARHYAGLLSAFVLDKCDAGRAVDLMLPTLVTNTLMRSLDDKISLARACLDFCAELRKGAQR